MPASMFSLWGFAAKTQHPLKALGGSANADMTAHDAHWAAVFDGAGGVPPPLRPEALSQDLRDCVRHNLRQRFKAMHKKTKYTKQKQRT